MSLARFLLSINHDDPEVVLGGLISFRDQILSENDAVETFGYFGRSSDKDLLIADVLFPPSPAKISGVLNEYMVKSGQLEELFVLWNLPNRDEHRALCSAHMSSIAAILHVGKQYATTCNSVVSRVLCDHVKSLLAQLTSGNTELTHATLGLILAMVRSSPQNCRDVFQKLNFSSQALDAVVQKGKVVTWKCPTQGQVLQTDSRHLLIMIVCVMLESVDENAVLELFAEKSLMRKVMHSIGRDSPETLQVVLPGVLQALQNNPALAPHVHDLFDGATVKQLVLLYSRPEESVQRFAHSCVMQLVQLLSSLQAGGKRRHGAAGGAVAASVNRCCAYLSQNLEPHSDPRQQEVLMAVLAFQPHLLSKSIGSISALKSWDPVPSVEYLGVMRYLVQLLQAAAIDQKTKGSIRSAFGAGAQAADVEAEDIEGNGAVQTPAPQQDTSRQTEMHQRMISGLLSSWLPPGLTKKDICKMLTHSEISLQRVGLQLVLALAQRLQRALRESGLGGNTASSNRAKGLEAGASLSRRVNAALEHSVVAAIQNYLPEFQLLVNMRARIVKALAESSANSTHAAASAVLEAPHSNTDQAIETPAVDDFDFNIEGAEEESRAVVQAEVAKLAVITDQSVNVGNATVHETLYVLFLEVVETYLSLSPQSVTTVKFDLLRLLDDLVPWETTQTAQSAAQRAAKLNPAVLLAVLKLLRQASAVTECRWFGYHEDTVKALINVIVAEDWAVALKRTALMKLLLLSSLSEQQFGSEAHWEALAEVARKAQSLLKTVLVQSGLFVGHGLMDFELSNEMAAWLNPRTFGDSSVLARELLLRLTYHWNTPLSISAAESATTPSYLQRAGAACIGEDSVAMVPFSPVIYCSLLLAGANFHVFAAHLPKHIRSHIIADDGTLLPSAGSVDPFFDKFNAQLRAVVDRELSNVLLQAVLTAWHPVAYCLSVLSGRKIAQAGARAPVSAVQVPSMMQDMVCLLGDTSSVVGKAALTALAFKAGPLLVQVFASLSAAAAETAQPATKKGRKAVSESPTAAPPLYDFTRNVAEFPVQCALILEHWSKVQNLLTKPVGGSEAQTKILTFVEEHWSILHKLVLAHFSDSLSAEYFQCVTTLWEQNVRAAHGQQAKIVLVRNALELLTSLAAATGGLYSWEKEGGLILTRQDGSVAGDQAGKGKKRSQSEINAEKREHSAKKAFVFCKAVAEMTMSLLPGVLGATTASKLLLADTILGRLASNEWFGSWVREAMVHLVAVSSRHRSSAALNEFQHLAAELAKAMHSAQEVKLAQLERIASGLVQSGGEYPELRSLLARNTSTAERIASLCALGSTSRSGLSDLLLVAVDATAVEAIQAAALSQLTEVHQTSQDKEGFLLSYPMYQLREGECVFYVHIGAFAADGKSSPETEATRTPVVAVAIDSVVSDFVRKVDTCLETIARAADDSAEPGTRSTALAELPAQLDAVHALVSLPQHNASAAKVDDASAALLKKKLTKLVKAALKSAFDSPAVLQWMRQLVEALDHHKSGSSPLMLGGVLVPIAEDFYHPDTLFDLIPSHSKFATVIGSGGKDGAVHVAKVPLLALLLLLTQIKYNGTARTKSNGKKKSTVVVNAEDYLLADALLAGYSGTMSAADRITLRILQRLADVGRCPALCTVMPNAPAGSIVTAEGPRSANERLADSARWMVEGIAPPAVYATLSMFPMWRSLTPQPLSVLEVLGQTEHPFNASAVATAWSATTLGSVADKNDDVSEEGRNDGDLQTAQADLLLQCSDKILDPAFFMPAFLHVLRNREVSVRQLANCGALSLMIACLGSPCVGLRTCSLACLQYVRSMLEQQTPTRDAAFRERAQLTLLLSYIRNSFDLSSATEAPRLPLTAAVFLGRAAMNLMQPNHELFSRVNKYLLCRPFCDVRDVPLYDLLLVNGDAQADQAQRLAALRLFRDGLLTKQDHLNLCRKNAYNRLMLLFPLLAKDVRAGHAVLDLLDRGLSLRYSARYLLERCLLTSWLKLLAAPMGALQLPAATQVTDSGGSAIHTPAGGVVSGTEGPSTYYSKYLVRAVTLLRRVVASAYLLAVEDPSCATHLTTIVHAIHAVALDAVTAVRSGHAAAIPVEYFTQLVLCMWDADTSAAALGRTGVRQSLWGTELILSVSKAMEVKLAPLGAAQRSSVGADELQLSLLLLAGPGSCGPTSTGIRLRSKLRKASLAVLVAAHHPHGTSESATMALVRPVSRQVPTGVSASCGVLPFSVLDKLSALSHYVSPRDVHLASRAAEMTSGHDQYAQGNATLAWTVLANTDLAQLTALPSSLGGHFVLDRIAGLCSAEGVCDEKESMEALRWSALLWAGYGDTGNTSGNINTEVAEMLSANAVAQRLHNDRDAGTAKSFAKDICCLVSQSIRSAEPVLSSLHPGCVAVHQALASLKGIPAEDQDEALITDEMRQLARVTMSYAGQLLTMCDHGVAEPSDRVAAMCCILDKQAQEILGLCKRLTSTVPIISNKPAEDTCVQTLLQAVQDAVYRAPPASLGLLDATSVFMARLSQPAASQSQRAHHPRGEEDVSEAMAEEPDEMDSKGDSDSVLGEDSDSAEGDEMESDDSASDSGSGSDGDGSDGDAMDMSEAEWKE